MFIAIKMHTVNVFLTHLYSARTFIVNDAACDVRGWGFIAHAHFDNEEGVGLGSNCSLYAPFAPILEVALIVRYYTTGLVSDTLVKAVFCMLYEASKAFPVTLALSPCCVMP